MLVSHQKHSQIIDVVRIRGLALEVSDLVLLLVGSSSESRAYYGMVWYSLRDMRRWIL
jgi:hypothetical protein